MHVTSVLLWNVARTNKGVESTTCGVKRHESPGVSAKLKPPMRRSVPPVASPVVGRIERTPNVTNAMIG